MNTKELKIQKLSEGLKSTDHELLLQTIKEIRVHGNPVLIPDLIKLLRSTQDREIKKEITSILADIKDKNAVPFMLEAIKDTKNHDILDILVSTCWQSGFDYRDHLPVFIEIFLKEPMQIAFEAFTLIECMAADYEKRDREQELQLLKSGINLISIDKKPLFADLVHILES